MRVFQKYIWVLFIILTVKTFAQKSLDLAFVKKVEKASLAFKVKAPETSDPVSVDAKVVWNSSKTQVAVVVKAKILAGWHIYAYVPNTQPYIQYDMVLNLPKSATPLGDWTKPNSYLYEDNIFVYKGELVFIRYFSVKDLEKNAVITAGLFYQTCDIKQCLQPNTKSKELKL